VSGSHVVQSVLFNNVRIRSFCNIHQCVLLPGVEVGRNCRLTKVIVDRACVVPDGLVVGEDAALRAHRQWGRVDHQADARAAVGMVSLAQGLRGPARQRPADHTQPMEP